MICLGTARSLISERGYGVPSTSSPGTAIIGIHQPSPRLSVAAPRARAMRSASPVLPGEAAPVARCAAGC